MIPPFPVYLFDVDGTLVDSASDICGAIQDVLSTTSQNCVEDAFLRRYIGRHLLDLFQDLLPEYTASQIDDLIASYRRIYPLRNHSMTSVYPGVKEALAGLGGRKSTATTKGTPTTRTVLELFGLLPYFDHVQGTDGFPAKPEPDVIYAALKGLGASREDCLFVGDSAADMEAGKRAGVKTCAVLYGYGERDDLAKWEPDYWISDPQELISRDRSASAKPTRIARP
jgi:HAD superfamily hydrolase (TIGR01549 family)